MKLNSKAEPATANQAGRIKWHDDASYARAQGDSAAADPSESETARDALARIEQLRDECANLTRLANNRLDEITRLRAALEITRETLAASFRVGADPEPVIKALEAARTALGGEA